VAGGGDRLQGKGAAADVIAVPQLDVGGGAGGGGDGAAGAWAQGL